MTILIILSCLESLESYLRLKKFLLASGIRFDYLMADKNGSFLYELSKYHISGQLKVAPEHISDNVLKYMGKPKHEVFEKFSAKYKKINEELGKEQFLVPYLMSSHPGSTLKDAVKLAEYLRDTDIIQNRCRIFIQRPEVYLLVCIIPVSTLGL